MDKVLADVGLVAIGRNEGDRLRRCLRSVPPGVPIVYVDSASSDGSVAFARSIGVEVLELDLSRPFTAARARNEGYNRLRALADEAGGSLEFVQFVDGDCELEIGWLNVARRTMADDPHLAVVCGRRRERYPEASFYNRLCHEEWDTPIGPAAACGGDALISMAAFDDVSGYDSALIAGEEPEMCHRLRHAGWTIRRIDAPMTIHDAAMHRPRQWWLRAVRSGFGYAQVWRATARGGGDGLYAREVVRALGWTVGVPVLACMLALVLGPIGLLAAPALWVMQFARLARRQGMRIGAHMLVGKFAETLGIARYAVAALRGRGQEAIFYK